MGFKNCLILFLIFIKKVIRDNKIKKDIHAVNYGKRF